MQKFARHKTYDEVKAQCKAQGVFLNDAMYREYGWDTVAIGIIGLRNGYVIYNTFNGCFFGKTPSGVEFTSDTGRHDRMRWMQALLKFFYVEHPPTTMKFRRNRKGAIVGAEVVA